MRRKSKNKKKHIYSKKEFIFDIVSLIIIIGICMYYGGRSLYYYSLQNKPKDTTITLNKSVIDNNRLVKDGDGLHRDSNGYYFKGNVTNNYVYAFNRYYRILRVNNDSSVRLVSNDLVGSFMWGVSDEYSLSNLNNWLTKTSSEGSGVYYDTIPTPGNYLVKSNYSVDTLNNDKINTGKSNGSDYVVSLGLEDYINAGGAKGFLNMNKLFYLIGNDSDGNRLFVDDDGSISSSDGTEGYGLRAVITLKSNSAITSGDGTSNNPYKLKQDSNNYVDTYVKLGNDTWKVYNDSNGILRMYLCGYINNNGIEVSHIFSRYGGVFNTRNRYNIGYYLNYTYLNSLGYKDYIINNNYYIGEVGSDSDYNYNSIYSDVVNCKVGLLNIFDYVSKNDFNDYFHINTISSNSDMVYSTYSSGLLSREDIGDSKHIVPVISINSSSIKSGEGSIISPYLVG